MCCLGDVLLAEQLDVTVVVANVSPALVRVLPLPLVLRVEAFPLGEGLSPGVLGHGEIATPGEERGLSVGLRRLLTFLGGVVTNGWKRRLESIRVPRMQKEKKGVEVL